MAGMPLALRPPKLFTPYERKASKTFVKSIKYIGHMLMGDTFNTFMPPKRQKWDPESINIKIRNTIGWDEVGDDHKYNMVVGHRKYQRDENSMDPDVQYYCAKRHTVRHCQKKDGYYCKDCNSRDQTHFVEDRTHGDIVCTRCGLVIQRKVDDGDLARHFEDDEEDTRHYGMAANPLLSMAANLRTDILAPSDKKQSGFKQITRKIDSRDTWFGSDGSTHQAYRDDMIIKAMDRVTLLHHMSEITIRRGLENFARFRNYREHVHKFDRSLMCCIALALYDVYLDQKRYEDDVIASQTSWPCSGCGLEYATRKDTEKHQKDCSMIPLRKRKERERKKAEHRINAERCWELTVKRCTYIEFGKNKKKRTSTTISPRTRSATTSGSSSCGSG